jgi:hypothetical protein
LIEKNKGLNETEKKKLIQESIGYQSREQEDKRGNVDGNFVQPTADRSRSSQTV